jgi:3-oxoacyl-(acyl-carrier-protein) synthase
VKPCNGYYILRETPSLSFFIRPRNKKTSPPESPDVTRPDTPPPTAAAAPCLTGAGLLSPLAVGLDEHWDALAAARPPERRTVPEFQLEDYLPARRPYLDRNAALGLLAAALALGEAGIEGPVPCPASSDLAFATAFGPHGSLARFHDLVADKGPRLASPMLFPHTYLNTAAGLIAIEFALRGAHMNFCDGPDGAAHALWLAERRLRDGASELALAGGVDTPPEPAPPGAAEGAAFLTLESPASAARRGVEPWCRLQAVEIRPLDQTRDWARAAADAPCLAASAPAARRLAEAGVPARELAPLVGDAPGARLPLAVGLAALGCERGQFPAHWDLEPTAPLNVADAADAVLTLVRLAPA